MKKIALVMLVWVTIGCNVSQEIQAQNGTQKKVQEMKIGFENDDNYTATYTEAIAHYKALDTKHKTIQVNEFGMTDSGYPLHEVIITADGIFDPSQIRENRKAILFVNNAIHPGEPCGVDASMMLARDLQTQYGDLLRSTTVVIIPIYNISGHLNRGSFSRANQQGPQAYGFRGNAQNLDLNRDFIKGDTENARSFNQLYSKWSPDIFIDNHTSNGADYPYVMTIIPTQKDKMEAPLSTYMQERLLPDQFSRMKTRGYEMTPYVYARTTPDEGIAGFLDLARYSSGYANLHNSISFMPETHMLKPFNDRVMSTYYFMVSMLEHISENKDDILEARAESIKISTQKTEFDINWTIDRDAVESVNFKGYTAKYKPSKVSGIDRLYYDHNDPYEKEIPFYNTYKSTITVKKPNAYIIPRAYKHIVDRMKSNGVEVFRLNKDEIRQVEIYKILDYESPKTPYEGHFLHKNVALEKSMQSVQYHKGDYIIYTNQAMNKYIIETLEPQGPDSWFAWNYFDGILMQKEHFSSYVFEDLAAEFLNNNPAVKDELESRKKEDPEFAKNAYAQLNFVYEKSPHYEPTFMRYPVGRLID